MAGQKNPKDKRLLLAALSVVALGITFAAVFEDMKYLGIVLIATGGLLLIFSIRKSKDDERQK